MYSYSINGQTDLNVFLFSANPSYMVKYRKQFIVRYSQWLYQVWPMAASSIASGCCKITNK